MTAVDETTNEDDGGFAVVPVTPTVSTRLVVSTADDDQHVLIISVMFYRSPLNEIQSGQL